MRIDFEKENTSITFISDGNLMYVYTKEGQMVFSKKDLNGSDFFNNTKRVFIIYTKGEQSISFSSHTVFIYLEYDDYFKTVEFLYKWKKWMFSDQCLTKTWNQKMY